MKRRFTILTAALALLTFLAVPMGMRGQNYSFPSELPGSWSTNGGTQTISNIPWTYSSSTYIALDNSHTKVQIGSSKNPQTSDWTIQTPIASFGDNATVTEIAITAYTTATTATYDISVGGNSVKNGSLTTSSATYTASNLNVSNGAIVVTMTGSNSSKAMYLSNIAVTYTSGPATYTVTYNANDGSTTPATFVDNNGGAGYESGASVTVMDNDINSNNNPSFSKTGYSFGAWSDMQDGTDDDATLYYPDDDELNTFNITENTTLYAQWDVNKYNYTLYVTGEDGEAEAALYVGGNAVGANAQIAYGSEVTVSVLVSDTIHIGGVIIGYIYSVAVKDAENNDVAFNTETESFFMPDSEVTVTVTTTQVTYYGITCVSTTEEVGSLFANPGHAYEGQTVTLSYLTETGYVLSSIEITKTADGSATDITLTASGDDFIFAMPAYAVTATATFVERTATFINGVYTEPLETQESFDNMTVVSVSGNQTWEFDDEYEVASILGGTESDVDWLISPKMPVDNGKLNISFKVFHYYADNQLSLKWSTSNNVDGNWNELTFEEGEANKWNTIDNLVIESDNPVYFAFVYENTTNEDAAEYDIYNFTARQYYKVTFNANLTSGVTGAMEDLLCLTNTATTLTANAFSSTGKAFAGWNTQADGNGTSFADGADITITENTTLYAQWTDAYTVNFTTNGLADGSIEVAKGQAIGTLPTATAEYIPAGYTFIGWLATDYEVSNNAPEGLIAADYEPSADVTLKAVFATVSDGGSSSYTLDYALETSLSSSISWGSYGTAYEYTASDGGIWIVKAYKNQGMQINTGKNCSIKVPNCSGNITSIVISCKQAKAVGFSASDYNGSGTITYLASGSDATSQTLSLTETSVKSGYIVPKSGSTVITKIVVNYITVTYSNYRTSYTDNYESSNLNITGYGTNTTGGWYLIASPVLTTPSQVENLIGEQISTNPVLYNYDLYRFNQAATAEWENYHQHSGDFNIVPGQGYLYANKGDVNNSPNTVTLTFTGAPYNGDGIVPLTYSTANEDANMHGWNLIGNPFAVTANLPDGLSYYTLNEGGSELVAGNGTTIGAMEAIFVKANGENESVTFTAHSRDAEDNANANLALNLSSNSNGLIDRAIVRFDEGRTLPKFMLNENHTKIYISQNGKDYAVVNAENQGERPINFKAEKNGTYTLSYSNTKVNFSYLHLVDNMTGADVDLLETPGYTFEATTSDYASRFKLVFATGSSTEDSFAFYSNGNFIISNEGEATLQVVDVTGRIMMSETVNGSASVNVNAAPGVYMLRLINGDNVKVQKVVVR